MDIVAVLLTVYDFSSMFALLTLAGLAVLQQPVSLVTATAIAIEHAHTLMIATVVHKRTVVDH